MPEPLQVRRADQTLMQNGRPVSVEELFNRSRHRKRPRLPWLRTLGVVMVGLGLLVVAGTLSARHWLRVAVTDSLPQVDGSLSLPYLSAPVTVARDDHGIPHIRAASLDDLVLAQGYVTAQDRLWQLETLRRHGSGTLAEILGAKLIDHDRLQRVLQLRAAADRAMAVLPPDQLHFLDLYAQGVNASMDAQQAHLPVEFRILRFAPQPWTPRDSLLVSLVMFEDLTNGFSEKLGREAIAAKLPAELLADLYPVGSWRDHPVVQEPVDLTQPQPEFEEIPLDESQTLLRRPGLANPMLASAEHVRSLLALQPTLALLSSRAGCEGCAAGSNNWVVAGSRTATGKPLLSNDMHLSHGVPGIWYEADLAAPGFHVEGVTLPGTPFVIVGHNDHIAWGFTNLGADVQDLTIEHLRGSGDAAEYEGNDGSWHPLAHQRETIRVKGGNDVVIDVPATQHGALLAPIISSLYPGETRAISLTWTIYDPANLTSPFLPMNRATDVTSLIAAFARYSGPTQNMVCADDAGHIAYHAIGRVPLRGDPAHPSLPPAVPVSPTATNAWAGYLPYDQMPHAEDPAGGILATANARVVPSDFAYPITLDWAAPYRNERIWKVLTAKTGWTSADSLALQTDIYSDLDHVVAQRLAYAIDHSAAPSKRLHQAADLLRQWNGRVSVDAAAPAIVDAARAKLWQLLLTPRLGDAAKLYSWGGKPFAEEQLIVHTPPRWLPSGYKSWDDLLAAAVDKGLEEEHAPSDLSAWRYGKVHPVDIEHPIFSNSPLLARLLGMRTGTGELPQSGDGSTVKQVRRAFGPSERFTANLADLDHSTMNLVLGQSGNPASPWFMDQWPAWYGGTTFALPYTEGAVGSASTHTLTLHP